VKKEIGKAPKKKLRIQRETLRTLAVEPDYLKAVRGGGSAINGTCHPSPICPGVLSDDC
jgi:hypothetical protein